MKASPLKMVRKYCLWCCCNNAKEVALCTCLDCPLYNLRFGKSFKGINVLKAVKERCRDCGEGTANAVKNCEFPECQLHGYRQGHNPARQGLGRKGGNPFLKPPVR